MTIYSWPPVGLVGWELTEVHGTKESTGIIAGQSFTSSGQPMRRHATAVAAGIGPNGAGAGYVESLKALLKGGEHFVRVECMQSLWWRYRGGEGSNTALDWVSGSSEMLWGDLLWSVTDAATATPTTQDGFPALAVSGFRPNIIVAYPSEYLTVTDGTTTEGARAVTLVRSDANGDAVIKLHGTITVSGALRIGVRESIVFKPMDIPRAVQGAGAFEYAWNFKEVLPAEYAGQSEVDPW